MNLQLRFWQQPRTLKMASGHIALERRECRIYITLSLDMESRGGDQYLRKVGLVSIQSQSMA